MWLKIFSSIIVVVEEDCNSDEDSDEDDDGDDGDDDSNRWNGNFNLILNFGFLCKLLQIYLTWESMPNIIQMVMGSVSPHHTSIPGQLSYTV